MKYKLIKSYPNSRETGTIVSPVPQPDTASKTSRYIDSSGRYYGWHEVEDYPEYWEEIKEPTFKVGEWVVDSRDNGIFRITKIDPIDNRRLFGSSEYEWLHSSYFRLATTQEIETHLIAEAKKRGYTEGTRIKGVKYPAGVAPSEVTIDEIRFSNLGCNAKYYLYSKANFIYIDGQWAEIVKEEEIKIGDYIAKFGDPNYKAVSFGCKSYSKESVNQLASVMEMFEIQYFKVVGAKDHIDSVLVNKIKNRIK